MPKAKPTPPPTAEPTPFKVAQDILGLVGLRLTKLAWRAWSLREREAAVDWAALCQLRASDNPVTVPVQPMCTKELHLLGSRKRA